MSTTQTREPQFSSTSAEAILSQLDSSLVGDVIRQSESRPEHIETAKFAFHPWVDRILNCDLRGFRFGIRHFWLLPRTLIALRTWPIGIIQPRHRRGEFAVGGFTGASLQSIDGAFPGRNTGAKTVQELQYPSASATMLLNAYGKESTSGIGMVILDSLTAVSPEEKVEAKILFKAVMETPIERDAPEGAGIILEALPKFLAGDAHRLLERAIGHGVNISGDPDNPQIVKLTKRASAKGEKMIGEIEGSVGQATAAGLVILSQTKEDLIKARAGQKDVKMVTDKRDNLLLAQFPSFRLDTDVDRAVSATAPLVDALNSRGGGDDSPALVQMAAVMERTASVLDSVMQRLERAEASGGLSKADAVAIKEELKEVAKPE